MRPFLIKVGNHNKIERILFYDIRTAFGLDFSARLSECRNRCRE